jgi:hypothetical protein
MCELNSGERLPLEEVSPSSVAMDSLDHPTLDYAVFPRGGQILKPNSKAFDGSVLTSAPYKGPALLHNVPQSSNILGNPDLSALNVERKYSFYMQL